MDTNLLVRVAVSDDLYQMRIAKKVLDGADTIAIPAACLCELVWVLRNGYGLGRTEVEAILTRILEAGNIVTDRQAAAAGIAVLRAGADFADGLIAYQGKWMGGDTFVSFDKKAVNALRKTGQLAQLLF